MTTKRLPRATPASKGVDPAGIAAFLDRASGLFGQQCIVLPGADAVIAFTAALKRPLSRASRP